MLPDYCNAGKISEARSYLRKQVLDNPNIPPDQKAKAFIDRLDVTSPKDKSIFCSGDLEAAMKHAREIDGVLLRALPAAES